MSRNMTVKAPDSRRGVSLLEVLISIGILAVGLTAAMALIPAGRTYLKKAAVDDRAAAMVPNAFATTVNLGLFRVGALTWSDKVDLNPRTDREGIWQVADLRSWSPWQVKTVETAAIDDWHPKSTPPTQFSGMISPQPPDGTSVTVSSATAGLPAVDGPGGSAAVAQNGAWSLTVPAPDGFFAPDMEIVTTGQNAGTVTNQPYVDYVMSATYTASGQSTDTAITPASFRQFGRLRKAETRTGKGVTNYSPTTQARGGDLNASSDDCITISFPDLTNTTSRLRGVIARSSAVTIRGTLWRVETGHRRGAYSRLFSFPNTFPSSGTPGTPNFGGDPTAERDAGDLWVDADLNPRDPDIVVDAEDWFAFDVRANEIIEFEWDIPGGGFLSTVPGGAFPVYFNSTSNPLQPFEASSGNVRKYAAPGDGRFLTRTKISPEYAVKQRPPSGWPGSHVFPYTLRITRKRAERMIAIDPLMATRLDKVISLRRAANQLVNPDPYSLRRDRFTDFQQTYAGSTTPRSFVVPRLNWQRFASGDMDTMLALAERLFRDEDNLAIEPSGQEDDAPAPLFDMRSDPTSPAPLRRQATGRSSWLLMVQPEDPGSVADNWSAGKYFDLSLVIYEDRKLPSLDAQAALEGEYAFPAEWNFVNGLVRVVVPFDSDRDGAPDLVGEDIRGLFKAGAWVLLAPKRIYSASPADDRQRLQWVKIRSAEFENTGTGVQADLLLEQEPGSDVLLTSLYPAGTQTFPLIVIVHDGVVAVVNKAVRLAADTE